MKESDLASECDQVALGVDGESYVISTYQKMKKFYGWDEMKNVFREDGRWMSLRALLGVMRKMQLTSSLSTGKDSWGLEKKAMFELMHGALYGSVCAPSCPEGVLLLVTCMVQLHS